MMLRQTDYPSTWTIHWDPINTPFTEHELFALTPKPGLGFRAQRGPKVSQNWVHPEDPLERIRHYNFWDLLRATLLAAGVSDGSNIEIDGDAIEEFLDWLANKVENAIVEECYQGSGGILQTHGDVICRILRANGLATGSAYALDSPSDLDQHLERFDISRSFLWLTWLLLLRVELALRRDARIQSLATLSFAELAPISDTKLGLR